MCVCVDAWDPFGVHAAVVAAARPQTRVCTSRTGSIASASYTAAPPSERIRTRGTRAFWASLRQPWKECSVKLYRLDNARGGATAASARKSVCGTSIRARPTPSRGQLAIDSTTCAARNLLIAIEVSTSYLARCRTTAGVPHNICAHMLRRALSTSPISSVPMSRYVTQVSVRCTGLRAAA
jgi:hypothetical protein